MRPLRGWWVLLAVSLPAAAQTAAPEPASGKAAIAPPADRLDSPAQAAVRKLPKQLLNTRPQRFSEADKNRVDTVTRLDEITIYGYIEPEDYVAPKKAPIMQLRDQLERDRPMTPWEKIRVPLCLVGLCANYGPDGIPREPSLDERSEARANQSTTQLNGQFRGTQQ